MISVVDHARLQRLKPPQTTKIPLNGNTLCIFIIILSILVLYKRYVNINQSRSRSHT